MIYPIQIILKATRRLLLPFHHNKPAEPVIEMSRMEAARMIKECLEGDKPAMIARFGCTELNTIVNYLGVKNSPHSVWKFVTWKVFQWWWEPAWLKAIQQNAGFFPVNDESLARYAQMTLQDAAELDILGSRFYKEYYIREYIPATCRKCKLFDLQPNYAAEDVSNEWTQALKGKNVLVVYPFSDTIRKQYPKRRQLFPNPDFMPEFNLLTIKAVQSLGGVSDFEDWFSALQYMKDEMDKLPYDVAIIGCGAYGFNLAAHAKRTGHKAILLGGATQLLFGIMGKRWEDKSYNIPVNEYWCRPGESERPASYNKVENGCYW